jgi:hypothetical protein
MCWADSRSGLRATGPTRPRSSEPLDRATVPHRSGAQPIQGLGEAGDVLQLIHPLAADAAEDLADLWGRHQLGQCGLVGTPQVFLRGDGLDPDRVAADDSARELTCPTCQ